MCSKAPQGLSELHRGVVEPCAGWRTNATASLYSTGHAAIRPNGPEPLQAGNPGLAPSDRAFRPEAASGQTCVCSNAKSRATGSSRPCKAKPHVTRYEKFGRPRREALTENHSRWIARLAGTGANVAGQAMPHHHPVFNSAVVMSPSGISVVCNADLTPKAAYRAPSSSSALERSCGSEPTTPRAADESALYVPQLVRRLLP